MVYDKEYQKKYREEHKENIKEYYARAHTKEYWKKQVEKEKLKNLNFKLEVFSYFDKYQVEYNVKQLRNEARLYEYINRLCGIISHIKFMRLYNEYKKRRK